MAGISTHVLDAQRGRPAAGVRIDLSIREGDAWRFVKSMTTNADGRTDGPVVAAADAKVGEYQLEFHIDDYFKTLPDAAEPFVDDAVVRFSIFDVKQHYHVPMLCTPGSCTTYRGS
ncbi:hydroxyisourate hydrolase [Methylobacterium sp. WL12]|uniref:hydroxyisourate hydrolase n=1 Tax=Methylobacterium sp. WL12 TaxID=2603890 RepID=UPI0011CA024F|nr:hydroxyisourate hydrolase [Methylobacterium sp. WL12]TXM75370.1 hydroxyisourate hydrolase [Methylobacterium sp. WL12]